MHSALGELTNPSNQALAYPIYGMCWPLGVIIGWVVIIYKVDYMLKLYYYRPLLGGALSNPAEKIPRLFNNALFVVFPYLLPCSVVAGMTFATVLIGFKCLKEVCTKPDHQTSFNIDFFAKTLPRKVRIQKEYSISYGITEHCDRIDADENGTTARQLLQQPVMRSLCASGCALSFVGTAFDVVFVLFCYSPIETGGLSFSVSITSCH